MDKETLSSYGWIIVVVLILAVMFLVAPLFGNTIKGAVKDVVNSFSDKGSSAMSGDDFLNKGTLGSGNSSGADDIEIITNYTVEEIEADDHLYAIGLTEPEYVVAKYNSDYTSVTISKNGADSDGKMNGQETTGFTATHLSTLKTLDIKNGVTSIGNHAFYNCKNLSSINIPDSVENIDYGAFRECSGLTSINIPDSVTGISICVFYGCSSLTSINISDNIENIDDCAFEGCENLTSINIPDSVTSVGRCVFAGCDNLTINCEALSQPSNWGFTWNLSSRPVNWGVEM